MQSSLCETVSENVQAEEKERVVCAYVFTPDLSILLFVMISFLFLDAFPPCGVLGIACIS